jgi:hypothetical protein
MQATGQSGTIKRQQDSALISKSYGAETVVLRQGG